MHNDHDKPEPQTNLANQPPPHFEESLRQGHEPLSVPVRALAVGAALILFVVFAAMLLMYGLVIGTVAPQTAGELRTEAERQRIETERPPDPQVEPNQAGGLEQLTKANERLLESYGWVDERQGIARIPVERAIELLAERGDPALKLGDPKATGGGASPGSGAAETNGR